MGVDDWMEPIDNRNMALVSDVSMIRECLVVFRWCLGRDRHLLLCGLVGGILCPCGVLCWIRAEVKKNFFPSSPKDRRH